LERRESLRAFSTKVRIFAWVIAAMVVAVAMFLLGSHWLSVPLGSLIVAIGIFYETLRANTSAT
jgi:hypothetical protein